MKTKRKAPFTYIEVSPEEAGPAAVRVDRHGKPLKGEVARVKRRKK